MRRTRGNCPRSRGTLDVASSDKKYLKTTTYNSHGGMARRRALPLVLALNLTRPTGNRRVSDTHDKSDTLRGA